MTEFARRHSPESTLVAAAPVTRPRLDRAADVEGDEAPLGNRAMLRWLAARGVRPKLEVSQPDDAVEREADAAAAAVMRTPEPPAAVPDASLEPPQISPLPVDEAALHRKSDDAEEEEKKAKGSEKDAAKVKAEAAEKEAKALDEKKRAKKKEEEDAKKTVMPKAAAGERPRAPDDVEARLAGRRGRGRALSGEERAFFEPRFGRDLGGVRLHTDAEAARTARDVRAQAFTTGRDIYFGAGRYQPGTSEGRLLLAHELAHTLQQAPGRQLSARDGAGVPRGAAASATPDAAGRAARSAVGSPQPVSPLLARQAEAPPAAEGASAGGATAEGATAEGATAEGGAPVAPNEVVSLEGTGVFEPSPAMTAFIDAAGAAGADVRVRLGALAEGTIKVRHDGGAYATVPPRGSRSPYLSIPLTHPALQPLRDAGVEPVVALQIRENVVEGYASVATSGGVAPNPTALTDWIREHATEMGWLGFDVTRFPQPVNELRDGVLRLQVTDFDFRLGGFLDGQADFGVENEAVTFAADATVHVQGLTDAQLQVRRDEAGRLSGRVEVPVSLASFSGNVIAEYVDGTVDVEGTARYETEKLSGEITLLVTDAATARDVALRRLGPDAVEQSAEAAQGEPAAGAGPVAGPRALAGWGVLDFRLTEWFTGQAQVIVDNEGHITIVGEIAPPAEIELFPQRDWVRELFTVEIRTLYGVPLVGNVFLFANIGLAALAKLGPGKIYNIRIEGTYSTDPRVFNQFSIQATLNISAFAGLRLRGEGGVGVELLGHDIKAGVGVNALAGIRGYVEATPTIGYREQADPAEGRVGEFFLHGHLELAAQPFLGLGGDLFVELDSPWWSPAPDEKWTWPLGELEYPLPGEFGIGADVDYVLGSDELPEITFGEVDFNADRFMTDLMNDHVPPARGADEERQGEWAEEPTGEAAAEAPAVVDSQGAPAADQPAQGQQEAGEQAQVPSPEVQQRWLQGLQALGELAEQSRSDPFSAAEIGASLGRIRSQYGFTELRPEHVGEDWRVHARMNPDNEDDPTSVEGEPEEPQGRPVPVGQDQFIVIDLPDGALRIQLDAEEVELPAAMSPLRRLEVITEGLNVDESVARTLLRNIGSAGQLLLAFGKMQNEENRDPIEYLTEVLEAGHLGSAAIASPVSAEIRSKLVFIREDLTPLSNIALVFHEQTPGQFTATTSPTAGVTEYNFVRDGQRRSTDVWARGVVEVDDNGVIVKVHAVHSKLPGGEATLIRYMRQAGWRLNIQPATAGSGQSGP